MLIEIFNLRYECLDAYDDFHAQMLKGDPSGKCGGSDFTRLVCPHGSRQGCLVQGITRITSV